ncbi:cytochrome b [Methanocella sp. CWC-04]|uniref:Cytochrome b n=1 Tax=Methanooceanicella nereidis TaxID=2052831 RepID=A0AAP2RGM0_9EURY|nr:cytochrome b/b6 domain-containing protein [Methanocella sp. CWC-04]MCD1296270.1 cytochrome b [Methanocella sp. CWC-04]
MKATGNRLIVTRHTTLERMSHYINIITLTGLIISGFTIYLGLDYLEFSDAYAIHIICAAIFISVNWIVMPYNAFVSRNLHSYVFWPQDYKRLIKIIKNFFTGSEYPRYTIYDMGKRRFVNRIHPAGKLLIYSHYVALLVATVTGVALYSSGVSLFGINFSIFIIKLLDIVGPLVSLSGLATAKLLHVAAGYWFVIEIILHAGMIQLDSRKLQHIRSIFIDGKEDLARDETAEIVSTEEEDRILEDKIWNK